MENSSRSLNNLLTRIILYVEKRIIYVHIYIYSMQYKHIYLYVESYKLYNLSTIYIQILNKVQNIDVRNVYKYDNIFLVRLFRSNEIAI